MLKSMVIHKQMDRTRLIIHTEFPSSLSAELGLYCWVCLVSTEGAAIANVFGGVKFYVGLSIPNKGLGT